MIVHEKITIELRKLLSTNILRRVMKILSGYSRSDFCCKYGSDDSFSFSARGSEPKSLKIFDFGWYFPVLSGMQLEKVSRLLSFGVFFAGFFLCLSFTPLSAQCPVVESFMVDACGKERQDEFLVINSGANGFSISDLQLDFDANNNNFGSLNNDIHINHDNNPTVPTPCTLVAGDVSLIGGCTSVVALSDGDYVPPNSILIVQLGNTASQVYDFSALCGMGACVYVTKNSCDRTSGAFSNVGIGERTIVVSLGDGSGCAQVCTYDRSLLDGNDGAYFAPALTGNMQYGNMGCALTPIVDEPLASIAFAGNDTSICVKESVVVYLNGNISGSAISAMWSGGDGDFNDVQLLDAEYYPSVAEIAQGKVSLTLVANDFTGGVCPVGIATIEVNFDSLSTDIQLVNDYDGYGLACSGDANGVLKANCIDGLAPYDYVWNIGENKPINSGLKAGEYRVLVVDAEGCLGASSIPLTEPEGIKTSVETFPEGCNDEQGQVIITEIEGGVGGFELFLDDDYQTSLSNSPYSYQMDLSSGMHQFIVKDAHQCMDTVDFMIDEGYKFEVDIGPDVFIRQGEAVTVTLNYENSVGIEAIQWQLDSLLDCSHCESVTLSPLFSERVSVEVTDSLGCKSTDEMNVYVQQTGLYVPNVFSPNGDGINDYLTIFPSSQVARVDYFGLFNRSGNEILSFKDRDVQGFMDVWDGYYKGELLDAQAFIYLLRVTFKDGRTEKYQGTVTLVR